MRWVRFGKILKNDAYINIIHNVGETYGKRPSDLLKIENDVLALDFDIAVLSRARTLQKIESEKEKSDKKENTYKNGIEGIKAMQRKI